MKILDRLPINDQPILLFWGPEPITIERYQIAVWVSFNCWDCATRWKRPQVDHRRQTTDRPSENSGLVLRDASPEREEALAGHLFKRRRCTIENHVPTAF